jgi:hypothetical protein
VKRNCALVVYEPGPGVDVIDLDTRPDARPEVGGDA